MYCLGCTEGLSHTFRLLFINFQQNHLVMTKSCHVIILPISVAQTNYSQQDVIKNEQKELLKMLF